jgi:MFS family permease
MAHRGRRIGLLTGNVVGAAGAALCVTAGVVGSMTVMLIGSALLGATTAANLGARYAAVDLAEPERRARDLSTVVWSTTLGAVLGPNLTGPAADLADNIGLPRLTGPFVLATVVLLAAALVIGIFLRPDPLLVARERSGVAAHTRTSWRRVVDVLRTRPVLTAAIAGQACAHAVMVAVMVTTPLHMEHGGAELQVIGFVISLHVLGMFAFSPLVGWGADQAGRAPVLGIGGGTLLVAVVLCGRAPEGTSWEIFAGLFLLGVGWSFATVAAATLVVELAPLEARTDIQGAADLTMGLTAAAAGGVAGLIVGGPGFAWLNVFAGVLACGVLVAAVVAGARPRSPVLTES